jgi:hypothetical protein
MFWSVRQFVLGVSSYAHRQRANRMSTDIDDSETSSAGRLSASTVEFSKIAGEYECIGGSSVDGQSVDRRATYGRADGPRMRVREDGSTLSHQSRGEKDIHGHPAGSVS